MVNNYLLSMIDPERYDRNGGDFASPISHYPAMRTESGLVIEKRLLEKGTRMPMLSGGGYVHYDKDIVLTILKEVDQIWMSDSPSELEDMENLANYAKGKVLVAGLGLGVLAHILAAKEDVETIVIVEKNAELIRMITPLLPEKVTVVERDFRLYAAMLEETFDYYILDIWSNVSGDDLRDMLDLWDTIKDPNKRGAIWALNLAVEENLGSWRGHQLPSSFADECYMAGYDEIGDFVCNNWDDSYYEDEEEEEFYGEEEDAIEQFLIELGIDPQ